MKNQSIPAILVLSLFPFLLLQAQQPLSDLIPPGGETQFISCKEVPVKSTLKKLGFNASNTSTNNLETHLLSTTNTSAVGRISGNLSVSSSGSAVYSIPIALPPGIKDIIPELSLSYNSQGSDGLVGYGWNLSGLSNINRVGATPIRDGFRSGIHFDGDDRLSLDGQRLLLKSGAYGQADAQYKTEIQSNLKIKAEDDHSFLVTYPNGSRAWYGKSNSTSKLEYPITRWEDAQGNFIIYKYHDYTEEDGVPRIESIQYGSNSHNNTEPINKINFNYAEKSRPEGSYIAGEPLVYSHLLSSIEIHSGGNLFRKYSLTYDSPGQEGDARLGYDRLEKVEESDGSGEALPPTVFHYAANEKGISEVVDKTEFRSGFSSSKDNLVVGDYDGDGKTDVLYYDKEQKDKLNILLDLSDQTHVLAYKVNTGRFDNVFASTILSWNDKLLGQQAITTLSEDDYSNLRVRSYTLAGSKLARQYEKVFWVPRALTDTAGGDPKVYSESKKIPKTYISGDFNGDGLTDILMVTKPYSYQCDSCDSTSPEQVDTSGISLLDLNRNLPDSLSEKDLGSLKVPYTGDKDHLYAIEFDGDGKTDLLQIKENGLYVYGFNKDNSEFILKYELKDTENEVKINTDYPILFGDF